VALSSTTPGRLCRAWRGGRFAFALRLISRQLFGNAARFLFRGSFAHFFVCAPPVLFLEALAIQALLLQPLLLRPFDCGLGLLFGLALPVDLFLLMARLVLEHFALT